MVLRANQQSKNPERYAAAAAARKLRRAARRARGETTASVPAQFDHASSPRARRKARDGERKMGGERKMNVDIARANDHDDMGQENSDMAAKSDPDFFRDGDAGHPALSGNPSPRSPDTAG